MLDRERTEVRFNSEWLRMEPEALLGLLAQTTVARLLERDDFQKRMAAERADRRARAALPAAAGLRLGRGRSRRRAGGDRPEVQPALRPRHPDRLRPAAAVDPDDADPGRDRRRAEDEQVAGTTTSASPTRRRRCSARLMRIPDEAMAEYFRLLLGEERPGGPAERGQAGAWPAHRRALPRRGRGGGGRGALRPALRRTRGARRDRGAATRPVRRRRVAAGSICRS